MSRQSRTVSSAVGLSIFLVVALVGTAVVATTIRPWAASGGATYRAEFTSASRLASADQVRVAGVVVGRVTDVEVRDSSRALVTFEVDEDLPLTRGTTAQIRYLNLVGDRYLSLSEGAGGSLPRGATIPVGRTEPALDLNDLFNGFKPLFAALSPDDVNKLAGEIIATLQGEGTTVTQLLQHTADLTTSLADRDQVIGRVVDNLNAVLATVDDRQVKLQELIGQLTSFMTGLAKDRDAIGESIEHINTMADVTAGLLAEARPALKADIVKLSQVVATLDKPVNKKALARILKVTPGKLERIIRSGAYGSWFNFYLCDLRLDLNPSPGANGLLDLIFSSIEKVSAHDASPRCQA